MDGNLRTMEFSRHLARRMDESLADTRVVVIAGPRQSGKTTLVRAHCAAGGRALISLDDTTTLTAARSDPTGLLAGRGPVAVDEIQRAPELLLTIKKRVDDDPRPGQFLLTSSANLMTLPVVADSLAGRMEILTLLPLAQSELADTPCRWLDALFEEAPPRLPARAERLAGLSLLDRLLAGGYPEAVQRGSPRRRQDWMAAYLEATLTRDVREIAQVNKTEGLARLLRALAAVSGQLCNFSQLAGALGLDQKTAQRYVGLFEQLYLVRTLEPYSANHLSRLVKTPKLHFLDSGLLAALGGLTPARLERAPTARGPLAETFVYSEMLKIASWSEGRYRFSHYRDKDQREVDLVVENEASDVVGVEVKAGASIVPADLSGLRRLAEATADKFRAGVILYDGVETVSFGGGLWAVPFATLWTPGEQPG